MALVALMLPGAAAQSPRTGDLEQFRELALELVNQERRRRDLPPFELTRELNQAAQRHAEDMLKRDYYAHVSPEGETVGDRYVEAGGSRWRLTAENIAHCAECAPLPSRAHVERFHRGWMESPGHRKNILDPGVNRFGFGVIAGREGGLYAVQTFAGPGQPRGLEPGEQPQPLTPAAQVSRALELINRERRREGVPALQASQALTAAARNLVNRQGKGDLALPANAGILGALPADERSAWRSVSLIAGGCGGCGTEPVLADLRFFRDQWLDNPQYRQRLMQVDLTHLGFAVEANGAGRKLAIAVLGRRR